MKNVRRSSSCSLEWVQLFFECMNNHKLQTKTIVEKITTKRSYNRATGVLDKRSIKKNTVEQIEMVDGDAIWSTVFDYSWSFCSYLKHLERGKKKRRAIASPSMFLRMKLHIVEAFHLKLGKVIKGSTISIEGEEKKIKIISNLGSASLSHVQNPVYAQATQDATKFNECVSPELFAFMHLCFLSRN